MATETEASRSAPQVLATFELLEMILIHVLDYYEIRRASRGNRGRGIRAINRLQRVNSTFRDVVARSKTLGVGTFMSHKRNGGDRNEDQIGDKKAEVEGEDLELALNPLLHNFSDCTGTYSARFTLTTWGEDGHKLKQVELHGKVISRRLPARSPRIAGWRKMLIANKPMPLPLSIHFIPDANTAYTRYNWQRAKLNEGATLGDLDDEVMEMVRKAIASKHRV